MKEKDIIFTRAINDNETWNTCPKCGTSWKDIKPTPGVLHRTQLCARCLMKRDKNAYNSK